MKKLSEFSIVYDLAEHVARHMTERTLAELQDMTETLGNGDDSEMENVWEEICVQVQYDEFPMWNAYVETVKALLLGAVEELPSHEREALWLKSDQGDEWESEDEDQREAYPVLNDDIVNYLWNEHVLPEAGRFSNKRTRGYLDRATAID